MEPFVIDAFEVPMVPIGVAAHTEQSHFHAVTSGTRMVRMSVSQDPYQQLCRTEIQTGLLMVSAGYGCMDALTLQYSGGLNGHGPGQAFKPLHLDISKYRTLVIDFDGSTQNLNINVVLFSFGGRTAWAENALFVGANSAGILNPHKAVIPVSAFAPHFATDSSYRYDDIHVIHIGIQNIGFQGGHCYAIREIILE